MDTNQLLESQCESLVKEVALIISQKWPQVNDSGRLLLQKLFDKFTEIFSRSEPDTDAQSEKPDIKDKIHNLISHSDLIMLSECNEILESFHKILHQFEVLVERLMKLAQNLSSLYSSSQQLSLFSSINPCELKLLVDELVEQHRREITLKRLLVEESTSEARFKHQSRVALMAAWLHEPFLNETIAFRFKALTDLYKSK